MTLTGPASNLLGAAVHVVGQTTTGTVVRQGNGMWWVEFAGDDTLHPFTAAELRRAT